MDKETEKHLDYLYERHKQLDHDKFELSNILDKYLFVAATGAIPLIISFKRVLGDQIEYSYLLKTSIGLFILSIFGTLLSIWFSVKTYKKHINITDQEIRVQRDEVKEVCKKNYWIIGVEWSSAFSGALFISGTIIASIFYYLNIN